MSETAGGGVIGDSDVSIAPVSGLLLGNDDAADTAEKSFSQILHIEDNTNLHDYMVCTNYY